MFSNVIENLVLQLDELLQLVSASRYSTPLTLLDNASVGKHLRHVIEVFQELEKGYAGGSVNYDRRPRNTILEEEPAAAAAALIVVRSMTEKPDKPLRIAGNASHQAEADHYVDSTYYRELLYCIEHAIHHMALIKIGVNHFSEVSLPEDFGIAPATIRYRRSCAQ